jgi:hypothetical protein
VNAAMRQMKLMELPSSGGEVDSYRTVGESIRRSFSHASPEAMQKVMAWLHGQPIRLQYLGCFEQSELEHDLSDYMSPHATEVFEDGRTVFEYDTLLGLPDVQSMTRLSFADFCKFLLDLQAMMVGGEGGFRSGDIATAADRTGASVRYPEPRAIGAGLRSIHEFWNSHVHSEPALAGVMAMAALLNLHPFMDGNGRVARVIFNWTLNGGRQDRVYLPLHEIAALSRCGYLIRLRQAQYHANWAPLLNFISMCGRRLFEE